MKSSSANIDNLIQRLIKDPLKKLSFEQIKTLCYTASEIFLKQPMLLEIEAPIKIFGDVHGHFEELLRLLANGTVPLQHNCLFLGDYVDRGKNSIETMCLLLCYKIIYPDNFFMLRGNHQTAEISKMYGFFDECKRKYNAQLWKVFTQCFSTMPVCAIISDKIICMHGGLSPSLNKLHQISLIHRPAQIPDEGLLADLLWSDPWKDGNGYTQNTNRGVSYKFGRDVVEKFVKDFDLDLIVRAHQVVESGYEFFADRKLITLFSVRNYCGKFDNAAAILNVDQNLICSVEVCQPSFHTLNKLSNLNITFRQR